MQEQIIKPKTDENKMEQVTKSVLSKWQRLCFPPDDVDFHKEANEKPKFYEETL